MRLFFRHGDDYERAPKPYLGYSTLGADAFVPDTRPYRNNGEAPVFAVLIETLGDMDLDIDTIRTMKREFEEDGCAREANALFQELFQDDEHDIDLELETIGGDWADFASGAEQFAGSSLAGTV